LVQAAGAPQHPEYRGVLARWAPPLPGLALTALLPSRHGPECRPGRGPGARELNAVPGTT
jgi:hypothetical protein